jgi:AcrR family transcriptional regulator
MKRGWSDQQPGGVALRITSKVANENLLAERHERLVDAATELFVTNGFHKTSVREIAAAAGWRMGTLYLYITRKEDVLYLIVQRIMAELAGIIDEPRADTSARDVFRAAIDGYFRKAEHMSRELRLVYREWASLLPEHAAEARDLEAPVIDFFAGIVARGIESREFAPVDARMMALNVINMAHFWALKGMLDQLISFDQYRAQQIDLLLSYLVHGGGAAATPTGDETAVVASYPPGSRDGSVTRRTAARDSGTSHRRGRRIAVA